MADSTLADLRTAGQTMLASNTDTANDLIYYWDDSQTGIAKSRSMAIAELIKLAGGDTIINKASDEGVTSSITPQNDNDFTFAMAANGLYHIEADILVTGTNGTGGVLIGFSVPADGSASAMAVMGQNIANNFLYGISSAVAAGQALLYNGSTYFKTPSVITLQGTAYAGASSGTFNLQWAQQTSSANTITFKAGSQFRYRKIN